MVGLLQLKLQQSCIASAASDAARTAGFDGRWFNQRAKLLDVGVAVSTQDVFVQDSSVHQGRPDKLREHTGTTTGRHAIA
ncbi:hypothetical protein IAQ61_001130 [Plenodomus lingam]|uniref:uncharacterized protein n=1 Tax=Leptosphaeria maculans TaxID=5022 RepID=UPI003325CBF8|nr:hypothetical protein IAQ61_001130 [Plenodomus lingam]